MKTPSMPANAYVEARPMSASDFMRSAPKTKPCSSFVAAQPQVSQMNRTVTAPAQSSTCSTRSRPKKPGKGGVATAASAVTVSTPDRRGR